MEFSRAIPAIAAILLAGCQERETASTERVPDQSHAQPPAEAEPLTLHPDLVVAFRLIEGRRTEAARNALATYRETHPDDGKAAFLVGLTYHREKRYARAEPYFREAVELAPGYHPTYHFQGWCLYYLGRTEESRRALEEHLEYVPTEGDSHFALGLIDLDDDRLDDAERRFMRAIELQEGDPRRRADVSKAHARLADIFVRRDDLERARAHLEQATALWPEHYTAFYKLSRVLTRLGDEEGAREAMRLHHLWRERAHPPRGVPEQGS
ncbi:MAG: tetratricopeptide repeat protein [Planctomycetota bacterium]|jgi:tetratricopeptide (TPR) repeat protein